ncbi:MAG: HmuY family protein [Bacteroidota bacterium]
MNRIALLALAGVLTLSACDSTEVEPVPIPAQTADDIEADPATSFGPQGPVGNGLFTLFDLDTGQVVLSSSETDATARAADSTGTAWDIGFRATTIIFNNGISGPGSVRAQFLPTTPFAELTMAPADGYLADGENTCPAVQTPGGTFPGAPLVVCGGSDNGWYNYNPAANVVTPIPGNTIVFQTSEGDYGKLRVLSYYRGNPATPTENDTARYYTLEYVIQDDGTRDFQTTDN